MKRIAFSLLCSVLMPAQASAGDLFELHHESLLGRVFMSPAERWQLDRTRHLEPITDETVLSATDTQPEASRAPRDAMGFFIRRGGVPSAWQDGGFRKVDDSSELTSLRVPENVKITRHRELPDNAQED